MNVKKNVHITSSSNNQQCTDRDDGIRTSTFRSERNWQRDVKIPREVNSSSSMVNTHHRYTGTKTMVGINTTRLDFNSEKPETEQKDSNDAKKNPPKV